MYFKALIKMKNQQKCKYKGCKVTMSIGSPIFCPIHNDKNKPSLLQTAKSIKTGKQHKFTPDSQMEEIALAWCNDEINLAQIAKALGLNNTGYRTYAKLALTLKEFIKRQNAKATH